MDELSIVLSGMVYPSYMMFIDPASNVSVPLTVVMRTRSRVPERDFVAPDIATFPASLDANTPDEIHVLVDAFIKHKVTIH